jgi:hypothetical protein
MMINKQLPVQLSPGKPEWQKVVREQRVICGKLLTIAA